MKSYYLNGVERILKVSTCLYLRVNSTIFHYFVKIYTRGIHQFFLIAKVKEKGQLVSS